MPGCCTHVCLFLFALFARGTEVKMETTLTLGLYSRAELNGETLDQHTADSLLSVEWTKTNRSSKCLCFRKNNNDTTNYSQCCSEAHFYLNNNSLILENVTARDEGVFMETIILKNGNKKFKNFTLEIIQYPPNATEIVVSWTSTTSVTLTCEVSGSFLHLMWKREGVPVQEEHRHSFREKNRTLHISNITSSDYGTYSCIVSNQYGESERHTYIAGVNSTVNRGNGSSGKTHSAQILLSSGFTLIGVLGLCIVIYCLYKHHHRQRAENKRTADEGDVENDLGINQDVADTEEVAPLSYVYTDFIKPKETHQASAAAQHFEDFGYSLVGQVVLDCISHEQSTACPDTGEE